MSSKFVKKKSSIFRSNLRYKITPKKRSINIDDDIDFKIAEYLNRIK